MENEYPFVEQHLSRALDVFFPDFMGGFCQLLTGSRGLKRVGGTVCSLCFSGGVLRLITTLIREAFHSVVACPARRFRLASNDIEIVRCTGPGIRGFHSMTDVL